MRANIYADKFAERQELRKQKLPHSFLKQKIYYNHNVEV